MGRRAQAVRVIVPILAIAAVAGFWIYNNQNNSPPQNPAASFQAGSCIDGTPTGAAITAASCSGNYDARIDSVLAPTELTCPPQDDEFLAQPPNPNLCINFTEHSP